MPKYQLLAKLELTNLECLRLKPDFVWCFNVMCTNCHESHDSTVEFLASDQVDATHSRSTSNLVMKCKFCSKVGTLDIVPNTVCDLKDSREFQTLVQVEGRGWEITEWKHEQVIYGLLI